MIDLSNIDDVNRERVLLTLSYNRFTPKHITDSATYSASVPIAEINTQPANVAKTITLLINNVYKLVASLITGSAYPDGGIAGTGHIPNDDASMQNRADFIVAKAYQGGGIGGSGNAPDNTEVSRLYISQPAKHINDVVASGGMSGTGHIDDDAIFPREGTTGVVVAHAGGGIAGTGHTDTVPSDMLTDLVSGSANGNNAPPVTIGNSSPVLILGSANLASSPNGAQGAAVTDPIIDDVNNHLQPPANPGVSDSQPGAAPDGQPQATSGATSEDASTVVNLLFDETQLLSDDSDVDVMVEPDNSQLLTLPAFVYELHNEFNQGSSQPVIC